MLLSRCLLRRPSLFNRVCAANAIANPASAVSTATARTSPPAMSYSTVQRGALHSLEYRLFFKDKDGNFVSPWHDIPL